MTLHISDDLHLPLEFATEAFALLARRGAGKSNALIVIAEELHANGLPFVHIDPKGDSWGIRSSGDGTGPGLAVPVFGGRHGDVPLESTAGALIADLILGDQTSYLSCVLDVSSFSKGEAKRFLHDFGDRLFRQKDESGVLTLLFEEAHEYLPQRVGRDEAQLVNVYQRIVKQGRQRGLGCGMATQRSAALNKDVLTQVGALIPMWIMSPQDRAAIKDWVDVGGEAPELIGSLHALKPGEAWIWWPERYDRQQRITFRRRWTFDSGATPKPGQKRAEPRTLADVDLGAVKEAMAETIEKAKADDPRELRKQIRDLERQIAERPEPVVDRVEVPVITDGQIARLEGALAGFEIAAGSLAKKVAAEVAEPGRLLNLFAHERDQQYSHKEKARSAPGEAIHRGSSAPRSPHQPSRPRDHAGSAAAQVRTGERETRPANPSGPLVSRPQQKILDALAWFEAVGIATPTRGQVAFQARVSPKSSGFEKNCSTLRTAGLIDYPGANRLGLTDDGRGTATAPDRPGTSADLQQAFYEGVSGPQATLLRALVDLHPDSTDRQSLANAVGVSSASSGFEKNISTLRSLGLIDYPSPGFVAATDLLFLD